MSKVYHVLNGDVLLSQFPEEVSGEKIVARECLIVGDLKGDSLAQFYQNRAAYLYSAYNHGELESYYDKAVTEFSKIESIQNGSEINLWFEDDLFCQTNFWFVAYLLNKNNITENVFWVRPEKHSLYGFGALNKTQLKEVYQNRISLNRISDFSDLWQLYKEGKNEELLNKALILQESFPQLLPAVKAHIERIPTEGNPGRPVRVLKEIMKELQTEEFGPVFREFCKRESIYGFGDLQVKQLLDDYLENK